MAFNIPTDCVGCGLCKRICPTDAVTGEKKQIHWIDTNICIECGACGLICPKEAVLDSFGISQASGVLFSRCRINLLHQFRCLADIRYDFIELSSLSSR